MTWLQKNKKYSYGEKMTANERKFSSTLSTSNSGVIKKGVSSSYIYTFSTARSLLGGEGNINMEMLLVFFKVRFFSSQMIPRSIQFQNICAFYTWLLFLVDCLFWLLTATKDNPIILVSFMCPFPCHENEIKHYKLVYYQTYCVTREQLQLNENIPFRDILNVLKLLLCEINFI